MQGVLLFGLQTKTGGGDRGTGAAMDEVDINDEAEIIEADKASVAKATDIGFIVFSSQQMSGEYQ